MLETDNYVWSNKKPYYLKYTGMSLKHGKTVVFHRVSYFRKNPRELTIKTSISEMKCFRDNVGMYYVVLTTDMMAICHNTTY